jgi:hypothetical protein
VARVNDIRFGGGANRGFTLDATTVSDGGLADTLRGQGGQDWFLFGVGDTVRDKANSELLN